MKKEVYLVLAAALFICSSIIIATSGESILVRYMSGVVSIAFIVKLVQLSRNLK